MPTSRRDVVEFLAGCRAQMDALGYPYGDLPVAMADQVRTSIAANLTKVDESHVLAYLTGLFMAHSATYMHIPCAYGHPRHLASVIYTVEAILPLLDDGMPDTSDLPAWSPPAAPEPDTAPPPPDPPEVHRRRLWPWR